MEPAEVESLLELEDSSAESWCRVFRRLAINRVKIRDLELAEIVGDALLKKVEDIGCKDKFSVWKIISIIISWQSDNYVYIPVPEKFHLPLYELKGEDLVNIHPYYPMKVNFNHDIYFMSRQLTSSFDNSDVKAINFYLNYGFVYPISVSVAVLYGRTAIWRLRVIAPAVPGHVSNLECIRKFENRLQLLDPHEFTNVRGCENLRVYQRGFKRIVLAALCIAVYQNRNTHNPEQLFQCLRLYFRAVADPLVQAHEIEELLSFFFFDVSKDYIDKIVQDIKKWYPESLETYRPRSLKHLCRCAIRQKLTDRPETFPDLLDRIGLPRTLKMYIMGDM